MSSQEQVTCHHHYINNCISAVYRGVLDYFATEFYPFNYKVISTYSKAVKFLNDKVQYGKETDEKVLPAITLDVSGDFNPEPQGGKFMWQYPNLYPAFPARLKMFDPIYKDDQIVVTPVFTRYTGRFDVIMWLQSVYEYIDVRNLFIMWSGGGSGRVIKPAHFWTYIVLPNEALDYSYENPYDVGTPPYQLDWRNTDAVMTLIRNMNKTMAVYPVVLSPIMKIDDVSDGSEKYGGADLPFHKLVISMTWECNVPTFLSINADWRIEQIKLKLDMGNVYQGYGSDCPNKIIQKLATLPGYSDLNDLRQFEIDKTNDPTVILQNDNWITYPTSHDVIDFNPITSGPIIKINDTTAWQLIQPGDIVVGDIYNNSLMQYIRLAKGFITKDLTSISYLSKKAALLQTPIISGLSQEEVDTLVEGNIVTFDIYTKTIYDSIVPTVEITPESCSYGSGFLSGLRQTNPEIITETSPDGISRDLCIQMYDCTGKVQVARLDYSSKAIYEFTAADFELPYGEHIVFDIPYAITDPFEIILVSYLGELKEHIHYEADITDQKITLLIPPKKEEMVEIYFFDPKKL